MFTNPYLPQYQPNYPQFQQSYQPQSMLAQLQQAQQPQQPLFSVAQVPTVESVDQIQLQPNERKIVLVQNQPVLAMRSADGMGLVNTRYFQLLDYDPHAQQATGQAEFAPLAAVQELQGQVNALAGQLEEMKGALSNGKPTSKRSTAAETNA